MRMNTAEKQALLKKTADRVGGIANLASRDLEYCIKLVHRAADLAGIETVFQRINEGR